ncbi:MAG TPA: hypothetical protein VLH86_00245 [Patescibacteria group bacterium]|nr:hypothetical protein [Patescibacteria group bacterium]
MSNRVTINKEVSVPELYFRAQGQSRGDLKSYPRRMEYEGREYTFMDGLRFLIQKGHDLVQVFDMTDGARDYRLKFDTMAKSWTLVDMSL